MTTSGSRRPLFLYRARAEALAAPDVRQEDLLAGGDPFAGKRLRQDQLDGMEMDEVRDDPLSPAKNPYLRRRNVSANFLHFAWMLEKAQVHG